MNEIRLSGILRGVVEHDSDGQVFITASLKFAPAETHRVLVVAAGASLRQLAPFDDGDAVLVIGRITVHKDGLAVLIDECTAWAIARQDPDALYFGLRKRPHMHQPNRR